MGKQQGTLRRADIALVVLAAGLISIAFVLDLLNVLSSRAFLLSILIIVVVLGVIRALVARRSDGPGPM